MLDFCRELGTNIQVESFIDKILLITDIKEKRIAIKSITEAERNIKDYKHYPTLTCKDNRDFEYRDDESREKLKSKIIDELFEMPRLENDDAITLGIGGAKAITPIRYDKIAFCIIGLPASGKSGIAAKISDKYGAYILDSDYAKRKLPEYTAQIGSTMLLHDESSELVFGNEGLLDRCLKAEANIIIPKIGYNIDSIKELCFGLTKAKYKVFLISVDLDRQKATRRAYDRFRETKRYIPLSLVFDAYSNEPTLNYFKLLQTEYELFEGYAQISTDVPQKAAVKLIEVKNIKGFEEIDWSVK